MSKTGSVPSILPAPPPPPPPIISVKNISDQREQSKGQITNRPAECHSVFEQGRKAVEKLRLQGLLPRQEDGEFEILSCYKPVKPVMQNGPVCGLVALSMASQLSNESYATTDDIFAEAQRRGFSKQGEMFSVSYMKELSSHFLSCPVEHLSLRNYTQLEQSELLEIVKHLLQGNILLVPYDADKNHSPCQRRGHKAHWALITGIVMAFPSLDNFPNCVKTVCKTDPETPSLFHWPDNPPLSVCKDLVSSFTSSQLQREGSCPGIRLYVYGHQGKSKHAGLWNLSELLQSNAQLQEAGPERSAEDYVIPPEGVTVGLQSQVLVVKRRKLD